LLRSLRTNTGLTTGEAAERLGFSRSKVSRLENGRRGASQVDILQICELYQVDDERRARLTELAAEGKKRAWWPPFSLPDSNYIGLEAEAASISDWGLALVPGLLQTRDYAEAILRSGVPPQEQKQIAEVVRVRMARQQRLLFSSDGPDFEAVVDESVLHRVVGNRAVMLAQLRQLVTMSELPNVTIRVVPYDAGATPAGVNKFRILRFDQDDIADGVLIEELTSQRYLKDPAQLKIYNATFQALLDLSEDPRASRSRIRRQIGQYGSQTSTQS
jgi:transcriptional regulator with XRE-family HTH domain